MATPPQTFRPEETMELIDAKAKANPERALFYVKVARKATNGLVPQQIAAFTQATLEHLGDPARWLFQLGGGGEYVLRVSHIDTQHQDIGGALYFSLPTTPPSGAPMRPIDASATFREGWSGPSVMVMPPPVQPTPGLPPNIRNMVFSGTPYASDAETLAAANAGVQVQQGPAADLARRERELIEKEAALRKEIAEKEAKIRDDRLLATIEAKNRDLDAKLERIAANANAPRRDESSWVEKLVASLVPLITQMMTSQHEIRMLMMKQSTEQSAAQMAAAERSHQQMLEFMKAAAAPKQQGMSEEMKMLIQMVEKEKASNGADAMAAMTMRLVDAMGMVTKNSISMMEAVAELNSAPEEHPAVAAIREGVKAIGIMAAGMRDGARKMVPQGQQPRMVAGPQQPQPRPQQPRPQPQPQPRPNGAPPQQPQRPAQTQPAPAVAAAPPPVAVVDFPASPAPAPAPAAPVGAPPAVAVTPQPGEMRPLPIDILENGIRQMAPIEEVAQYFVGLCKVKDASLFAALDDPECDGDPDKVIVKRLGIEFVAAHQEYLEALSDEIDRQGEAAGVVQHDDEEDDGDEPDEPEETPAEIVEPPAVAAPIVVQVPQT